MKETELAAAVVAYFEDDQHEVYKEVQCYGIIDIVVKCGTVILGVECKTALNFEVIEQAKRNKSHCHYSYIATPPRRRHTSFAHDICKMLGIGVLEIETRFSGLVVTELVKPKLNRKIIKPGLHDYMKRSEAGSQNNRMTSFKYFVESLHAELKAYGSSGADIELLFEKTFRHYHKLSYFKRNILVYIRNGVITNVEYKNKKLYYKP